MTKYRKLMRGQHVEERWLLTVANGRALGLPLLGWIALVVGIGTVTLMPGCATVPEVARRAELAGTPQATAMCFARWQGATSAAAACAETCASEDLSQYCARKKCALELSTMAAWAEVESWCTRQKFITRVQNGRMPVGRRY